MSAFVPLYGLRSRLSLQSASKRCWAAWVLPTGRKRGLALTGGDSAREGGPVGNREGAPERWGSRRRCGVVSRENIEGQFNTEQTTINRLVGKYPANW